MTSPTVSIRDARAKIGRNPKIDEAIKTRFDASQMAGDMKAFQEGHMTREEFEAKWVNK